MDVLAKVIQQGPELAFGPGWWDSDARGLHPSLFCALADILIETPQSASLPERSFDFTREQVMGNLVHTHSIQQLT